MTQIDADSVAIWIASPFTPTPLENSNDNRRPTDHTDKPRWAHTTLFCPARARPYIHGRAPLGRVVVPNASACHGNPTQRPALRERRPRQSSSSFNSWEVHISPTYRRQERQNRRASGTSAGEKTGCDERSRSEQTDFSPATGKHQIACRSASNMRKHISGSASAPLCGGLCVFVSLWLRCRRVDLR